MNSIDQIITADGYSAVAWGSDLGQPGSRGQAATLTAQIDPVVEDADFEVELHAAVGGHKFKVIGRWDQDEEVLVSNFDFSAGVAYRFRHVSGTACRVLLSG